tara:strand:- start:614 stop:1426 length:813 start_codon:yes stop_codon:yes gene_type:complete
VCQDPNAGARAAAQERNNQKIAAYKSNAIKYWNKETTFAKNSKFITGMGYSRDLSDLQVQFDAAKGKVFQGKEDLSRQDFASSYVDEGGGSRLAGRAKRMANYFAKTKQLDNSLSKLYGQGEATMLTNLERRQTSMLQKNKSQLGLPPEFGPPTMMPQRDVGGMILSGVQTGLGIASSMYGLGAFGNNAGGPLSFIGSDLRLKRDVDVVGTSPKGYKIYEYSYAGNPIKRFRGAMAQDVMKKNPTAVHVNPRGFFLVDYSKIDVDFEELN